MPNNILHIENQTIQPKENKNFLKGLKSQASLLKSRHAVKFAIATALLPIALATANQGCTLNRSGLADDLFGPGPDGGIGGAAGQGGSAGEGGNAGIGGEAGSAGEGGCLHMAEVCDGIDNNCNNEIDENLTSPLCEKTQGVCATPVTFSECQGESGWSACEYSSDYEEVSESTCDNLDNDCDGLTDEAVDLNGHQPACAEPNQGVCVGATLSRTCSNGEWSPCDYGADYEQTTESTCDQLDNNCDGNVDEPCVTTVYGSNGYEQLVLPNENTFTPLDGSTGNGTCETTDTIFKPESGNRMLVWVDGGANSFKIDTLVPPLNIASGCSIHTTDCPDNAELWNDNNGITTNGSVLVNTVGTETEYSHVGVACTRHTFILNW